MRSMATRPPVVALTATATAEIRHDIERRLELRDPVIVRGDFDRPEIRYIVYNNRSRPFRVVTQNDKFRLAYLLARSAGQRGEPMVIYTATTRRAEEVAGKLAALGLSARAYHGKMDPGERWRRRSCFLDDHVHVVVATKAFGMGIDKPDIRHVVHYDVPGDLESYLQETGRAGRDGQPAWAVLLFVERDRKVQDYFIDSLRMSPHRVKQILRALAPKVESGEPFDLEALAGDARSTSSSCGSCSSASRRPDTWRGSRTLSRRPRWSCSPAVTRSSRPWRPTRERPRARLAACSKRSARSRRTVGRPWTFPPGPRSGASIRRHSTGPSSGSPSGGSPATGRSAARCAAPGPRFSASGPALATDDPLVEGKRAKLERMLAFARSDGRCRREALLEYLGQPYRKPEGGCRGCDTCGAAAGAPWRHERLADVPNPSLLFDPERIALELIDANIARAEEERRTRWAARRSGRSSWGTRTPSCGTSASRTSGRGRTAGSGPSASGGCWRPCAGGAKRWTPSSIALSRRAGPTRGG